MNRRLQHVLAIPYYLWIVLFVVTPILLLIYRSFFGIDGSLTFGNECSFYSCGSVRGTSIYDAAHL